MFIFVCVHNAYALIQNSSILSKINDIKKALAIGVYYIYWKILHMALS
jgi:hypothetical protein